MELIDETEGDLIALIEKDFGSQPGPGISNNIVLAWLHYRARLIPERRRYVIVSDEVQAKKAQYPGVSEVEARFRLGLDVSPWLSDHVRHRQKMDARADLMFNDWQISHFHTGLIPRGATKAARGSLLLYAFVSQDKAILLDVKRHREWASLDLLRILIRLSPGDIPEIKGILGSNKSYSEHEIKKLRAHGIGTCLHIDGKLYFSPGAVGVVSSAHAGRIVRFLDVMNRTIRITVKQVKENTLPFVLMRKLAGQIGLPVRLGLHMQEGQFIVYEKNRVIALAQTPVLA